MPSLSVCVFANTPPQRLAALLSPIREVADEIVVAIDDKAGHTDLSPLEGIAEKAMFAEYVWPMSASLEWLHAQCSGDWILRLDGDEFASTELLDELKKGEWHKGVTHRFLPRKWLVEDGAAWIQSNPWWPDPQMRLVKNDPTIMSGGTSPHEHLLVDGPSGTLAAPIYHTDLVDTDLQSRRDKARRYYRAQPDIRAHSGHAMSVYYTPELVTPPPHTVPVPTQDVDLVASAITGTPIPMPLAAPAEQSPLHHDAASNGALTVDLIHPERTGFAGQRVEFLAVVRNTGSTNLDPLGVHPIRIGGRWFDQSGHASLGEARADLPHMLKAGESAAVILAATIPDPPGDYTLAIGGVAEGSHWFDTFIEVAFAAVRQPTIDLHDVASLEVSIEATTPERALEEVADRYPHIRVTVPPISP
jgi:hypothetical protein